MRGELTVIDTAGILPKGLKRADRFCAAAEALKLLLGYTAGARSVSYYPVLIADVVPRRCEGSPSIPI